MDGAKDITPEIGLYDTDFAAWSARQGLALRAGDWSAVDWPNVIEEIESLGRAQISALRSTISLILEHRLKLDHGLNREPERQWTLTVKTQQRHAAKLLRDNPSLRRMVSTMICEEYADARAAALDSFEAYEPHRLTAYEAALPVVCAYEENDIL